MIYANIHPVLVDYEIITRLHCSLLFLIILYAIFFVVEIIKAILKKKWKSIFSLISFAIIVGFFFYHYGKTPQTATLTYYIPENASVSEVATLYETYDFNKKSGNYYTFIIPTQDNMFTELKMCQDKKTPEHITFTKDKIKEKK